jgi:hypothetical protein
LPQIPDSAEENGVNSGRDKRSQNAPLLPRRRLPDLLSRLAPSVSSPPAGCPAQSPREKIERERERRKGEKRGKREEANVDILTCGVHVSPTLTQQLRMIKSGSKPLRDRFLLVKGRRISGIAFEDDFVSR